MTVTSPFPIDPTDLEDGYSASALRTIDIEIQALYALRASLLVQGLSDAFDKAVEMIAATKGRLIVTGMGKSGHIGRKIAATMRSTGTSAVFVHPGEASHGDLGLVSKSDVVLAISWSGETSELSNILRYCRKYSINLIVMTAHGNSTAAQAADICLELPITPEACPLSLAPTSSTTLQIVLGDAIAVALIEKHGFTPSDFHTFHPGGSLGSQLSTVGDLMGSGDAIPQVGPDTSPITAAVEMSGKRYGCTAVLDDNGKLIGVFTDGDLRRCLAAKMMDDAISQHMTPNPISVAPDLLATDALRIMNDNAVTVLFVQEKGQLVGLVHMHDIVGTGVA